MSFMDDDSNQYSVFVVGIIGCIDGCHVRIAAPKEFANSYINRKNYHSVLLQGVCDHQMLFTDVYAGEAGSIHDMNLFRRSDVYQRILSSDVKFHNDSHMIGDLAYKLSTYLMVGFKKNVPLDPRQQRFNIVLSKARVVIENAFALLKGRFRRLKFLETVRLDLVTLLIVTACILHNICLLNGDTLDDVNIEEVVAENAANHPDNMLDIDNGDNIANAIAKRWNIVNNLEL